MPVDLEPISDTDEDMSSSSKSQEEDEEEEDEDDSDMDEFDQELIKKFEEVKEALEAQEKVLAQHQTFLLDIKNELKV